MNITFDFDKMMKLSTNPAAFEAERTKIINSYIDSLPEENRQAAHRFQNDLDLKRITLSSSDFIAYCSARIQQNLVKVDALSTSAKSALLKLSQE